nr:hypothetical protein [Micromonospora sp. DSM 115978]
GRSVAERRRRRSSRRRPDRLRRWLARAAIALVTAVVAFGAGVGLRLVLADSADGNNDTGSTWPSSSAAVAVQDYLWFGV